MLLSTFSFFLILSLPSLTHFFPPAITASLFAIFMVGVRHLAPGRRPSHFFLLPSLACDTPVLCIERTVSRDRAKQIMMITLCILRESVGKSNDPPPRFHHRDANLQLRGPDLLVRVVQNHWAHASCLPCVFTTHSPNYSGSKQLNSMWSRSVHRPCGLRGAPNGRRAPHAKLAQAAPIHERVCARRAAGGGGEESREHVTRHHRARVAS